MEEMGEAEKTRLASQADELGEDGLAGKQEELDQAVEENEVSHHANRPLNSYRLKPNKALDKIPVLELRDVTCHMGSQCYLPPDTSERTPPVSWYSIYLPWRDGRLSLRRLPKCTSWESNSQSLDHKSVTQTTTALSHPLTFCLH